MTLFFGQIYWISDLKKEDNWKKKFKPKALLCRFVQGLIFAA